MFSLEKRTQLLKQLQALDNMSNEELAQEYIKYLKSELAIAQGVARRLMRKLILSGKAPRDWPESFTFLGRHIDWFQEEPIEEY